MRSNQMNAAMQLKMTMSRRVNLADGRSRERGGARCSRPEPVAAHSRQERLATTSRAFGRCKRCSAAARPTEHAGPDLVRVWACFNAIIRSCPRYPPDKKRSKKGSVGNKVD